MSRYLDYNATAPLRDEVRDAMLQAMALPGNPSSVHADGRAARALVDEARDSVAALFGVAASQVVFTGSGTEANALALAGPRPGFRLVSAIEHPSVLRPAAEGEAPFGLCPVDGDGVLDLGAMERLLHELAGRAGSGARPGLVSLMAANNETGVLQPVAEAARLAGRAGALFHCDAVQAAGRLALDFEGLGIDMLSLSAHKLGGPKGVGALILRSGLDLAPLISGGGQERGLRAGTENVAGIAGFGVAARLAREALAGGREMPRLAALRDRMEAGLRALTPGAVMIGAAAPRLANTACVALPGRPAETMVIALDLAGISVSSGSACSSGKVASSHVLEAMGLPPEVTGSALRLSLGHESCDADIDALLAAWPSAGGQGRGSRASAMAASG